MKQHILFITSDVQDSKILVEGVTSGIPVHILAPGQDGIQQITQIITSLELSPIHPRSIHIVSHGDPGVLYLGQSQLSLSTLKHYTEDVQAWFPSPPYPFSCQGRSRERSLHLYSCNVAATDVGKQFLIQFHALTGATIHASTTKVGHSTQGGSWNLDVTIPSPLPHKITPAPPPLFPSFPLSLFFLPSSSSSILYLHLP